MASETALPQLFGIVPTGLPPITTPSACPTPTSFLFQLPRTRTYSHVAVFILPGITLPPDSAAAVYISMLSSSPQTDASANAAEPHFKFLGGIGTGKESAIFKISQDPGDVTLGISLEPAASVSSQMAALQSQSQSSAAPPDFSSSSALVLSRPSKAPLTVHEVKVSLAQKIIKNAFNFLASYSGNLQNGVEVVPLKAFEEWWKKFEGRVRSDPQFLERDGAGD